MKMQSVKGATWRIESECHAYPFHITDHDTPQFPNFHCLSGLKESLFRGFAVGTKPKLGRENHEGREKGRPAWDSKLAIRVHTVHRSRLTKLT